MPGGGTLTRAQLISERARVLVIVARDQPDLWWYLTRDLARYKGVDVVLDRRQGGWRQQVQRRELGEFGADRRRRSITETDLRTQGYVVIHRQEVDFGDAQLN